jgi:type II secretory pathway pseudopilin PulG
MTLVETLIVVALIGALMGLLLPAVQASRAASGRAQCADNLHNIGVALHQFHDTHRALPFGRIDSKGVDFAWSSVILPFLEYGDLSARLDFAKPWDDPDSNAQVAATSIALYRCPSATQQFAGQIDYGGIMGSSLTGLKWGYGPMQAFGSGTLIADLPAQREPVRFASIIDGMSRTLAVSEAVDRSDSPAGQWASGWNCFLVQEAISHTSAASGIYSLHEGGAQGLFADASVRFLADGLDPQLLGALATRNANDNLEVDSTK